MSTIWQVVGAAIVFLAALTVYACCVVSSQADDAIEEASREAY